jgi:hypothetical protein
LKFPSFIILSLLTRRFPTGFFTGEAPLTVGNVTSGSFLADELHVPKPLDRSGATGVILSNLADDDVKSFISPPFGSAPVSVALTTIRIEKQEYKRLLSAQPLDDDKLNIDPGFKLSIMLTIDRRGHAEDSYSFIVSSSRASLKIQNTIVATMPFSAASDSVGAKSLSYLSTADDVQDTDGKFLW